MAITKAEAEGVARLFLRDYPGALGRPGPA